MRIQYLLCVLLFFLAGTLEPAAPAPCGDVDSGAVLSECGTLHRSDVLHRSDDLLCRVAAPEAGDVTELSEYHSAQRLPGAGNAGPHADALRCTAMRQPARLPACGFHPRPKEHYLYSLGRIVI